MSLKIEILCTDGSPLGVCSSSVWGDKVRPIGIGGSELALLTMCEEWTKRGDEVVLYNNPHAEGSSEFEQRSVASFDRYDERDILIIFRTPNDQAVDAKGLKVWWSCDQYTSVPFDDFRPVVDKVVCISPFHSKYFKERYKINDAIVIDLPARVDDYDLNKYEKIKNRLLFSSVPDRGLEYLASAYYLIQREISDVSLVITSDYRLWGDHPPGDSRFRRRFMQYDGVIYLGGKKRDRLIEEQLKASVLSYPNSYDELFCISVSEAQVAGAYPVTTGVGAVKTTNMGTIIPENPTNLFFRRRFADKVIEILNDPNLETMRKENQEKAIERFHPDNILAQWDSEVFDNE